MCLAVTLLLAGGCATAALDAAAANALLRPLVVAAEPDAVLSPLPGVIAGDPDWRLVTFDGAGGRAALVHYTRTFRFADDVVLVVTPVSDGESAVAATSTSRIGIGDFGQNARNLMDLLGRLREAWDRAGIVWREGSAGMAP